MLSAREAQHCALLSRHFSCPCHDATLWRCRSRLALASRPERALGEATFLALLGRDAPLSDIDATDAALGVAVPLQRLLAALTAGGACRASVAALRCDGTRKLRFASTVASLLDARASCPKLALLAVDVLATPENVGDLERLQREWPALRLGRLYSSCFNSAPLEAAVVRLAPSCTRPYLCFTVSDAASCAAAEAALRAAAPGAAADFLGSPTGWTTDAVWRARLATALAQGGATEVTADEERASQSSTPEVGCGALGLCWRRRRIASPAASPLSPASCADALPQWRLPRCRARRCCAGWSRSMFAT